MNRAHKVDANQGEIVAALRKAGALVCITSAVGDGFPDLLVAHRGRLLLLEVKRSDLSPSRRALTDKEQAFHREWQGHVVIVTSAEDALAAVQRS
jgi:Holliday junction resolvase